MFPAVIIDGLGFYFEFLAKCLEQTPQTVVQARHTRFGITLRKMIVTAAVCTLNFSVWVFLQVGREKTLPSWTRPLRLVSKNHCSKSAELKCGWKLRLCGSYRVGSGCFSRWKIGRAHDNSTDSENVAGITKNVPYAWENFRACAITQFQKPQQLSWAGRG